MRRENAFTPLAITISVIGGPDQAGSGSPVLPM